MLEKVVSTNYETRQCTVNFSKIRFVFEDDEAGSTWKHKLYGDMTEDEQEAAKREWCEADKQEEAEEIAEEGIGLHGEPSLASSPADGNRPCHSSPVPPSA